MTYSIVRRTIQGLALAAMLLALLALPAPVSAQDATLTGTVQDSSGGVLPGVTVTALHEASGNTFVSVTDGGGAFRLLMRTGAYRVTFELPGFATVVRTTNLLLGQTATVNLEMSPAALAETVTVTGEAPLLDTTSSTIAGNIDPRQMEELPINGRNWMDLAMLAPGSRQNQSGGVPQLRQGFSQINIDGQQVTANYIGLGDDQPRFSRDSIAEFELITNRFDVTQGRSTGMIANAITKSGTNNLSGSVGGYFRDDKFIAEDHVLNRVVPYQNKQISTTFGGPIRRDKVHFFLNYEAEREPQVLVFETSGPLSVFNRDIDAPRKQYAWGAKVDVQASNSVRFAVRGNGYRQEFFQGGGATHPSTATEQSRETSQVFGTMTWVVNNRTVNIVKGGYSGFDLNSEGLVRTAGGPNPWLGSLLNGAAMRVNFRGYGVGAPARHHGQYLYSVRDDLTTSYDKGGRHSVKIGGEYIYNLANLRSCAGICSPRIIAQNGAPTSINMVAAFPVWNDAATWNLNLIAPLSQRYEWTATNVPDFYRDMPQDNLAAWIQDDWSIGSKLTVNLGLRYDVQTGYGGDLVLQPILPAEHPVDINNFGPRAGFAFALNDRTVIRGGAGVFYGQGTADEIHQTILFIQGVSPTNSYDGRPDWPTNPWNGPDPTYDQLMATACDLTTPMNQRGCLKRNFQPEMNSPFYEAQYSNQASVGVQRQFGSAVAFETNAVWTGGRNEEYSENINLTYNPATGANYPSSDLTKQAFPEFGPIELGMFEGVSNYYGWENSITKRMSGRWQAALTYTLGRMKDKTGSPYQWGTERWTKDWCCGQQNIITRKLTRTPVPFPLASDMGGDYTLAPSDQRHRLVLNGIYEAPLGLQVSGILFYGSGQRFNTSYGGDLRGQVVSESRLRPNGTIVDRTALKGDSVLRLDMRLQKRLRIGARVSIDGMLELFNAFDRANFGAYTTQESSASYGQPVFSNNISYQPRTLQLGFRLQF